MRTAGICPPQTPSPLMYCLSATLSCRTATWSKKGGRSFSSGRNMISTKKTKWSKKLMKESILGAQKDHRLLLSSICWRKAMHQTCSKWGCFSSRSKEASPMDNPPQEGLNPIVIPGEVASPPGIASRPPMGVSPQASLRGPPDYCEGGWSLLCRSWSI